MTVSTVVRTIIQQLGGGRFAAMTGGKFIAHTDENTLNVRLPRYTVFTVMYDAGSDTYKVGLSRMNTNQRSKDYLKVVTKHTADGVYGDDLCALFTEWTGLRTSL
mgnify:CR=1 FL=1